ncbi:MAG TPA: MFS transporter, partial [Pseudorhodoplanes sp.]|nr:MFS transporter [Pseudorhodoplanes sp.]
GPMDAIEQPAPPISRNPQFLKFWFARIFATCSLQMLAVCVGWQIYNLTNSALDLGLVGLFQFIPAFMFVLIAGHVADHYHRGHVIQIAQAVGALVAAVLALGTAFGFLTREIIFALVFILGAARAFELPTLHALLPGLVPASILPRAIAASASATQAATIGGPALGGLLYAINPTIAYLTAFALLLAASTLISLIAIKRVKPTREPMAFSILFAGINFIRRNPLILGAISLDLFAVLLAGATALLPIFARDVFQTGPLGLGLLRAAPAVGALAMGITLARWPLGNAAGLKMFIGVAVYGMATIAFGLSTSFPLAMLSLIVLGAADMVSVVVRQTLVPLHTPDEMRGRVNAVGSLFIGTSNQLGDFRAGVMAAMFGAFASVLIGGIGTLLIVALWMRLFPSLLRVDKLEVPPSKT